MRYNIAPIPFFNEKQDFAGFLNYKQDQII